MSGPLTCRVDERCWVRLFEMIIVNLIQKIKSHAAPTIRYHAEGVIAHNFTSDWIEFSIIHLFNELALKLEIYGLVHHPPRSHPFTALNLEEPRIKITDPIFATHVAFNILDAQCNYTGRLVITFLPLDTPGREDAVNTVQIRTG